VCGLSGRLAGAIDRITTSSHAALEQRRHRRRGGRWRRAGHRLRSRKPVRLVSVYRCRLGV